MKFFTLNLIGLEMLRTEKYFRNRPGFRMFKKFVQQGRRERGD